MGGWGGVKGLRGLTDSCSPQCRADVIWMRTHAIMQEANAPLAAIWELRRQDVFVPQNSVNYTAVCVCMRVHARTRIHVLLFLTVKRVFFNYYSGVFFSFCPQLVRAHFFVVVVFWELFKATKNISDNSDASGKIKRLLYCPSPLLFTN